MRAWHTAAVLACAGALAAPAVAGPVGPSLTVVSVAHVASPVLNAMVTTSAGTVLASDRDGVRAYDADGRLLGTSALLNRPLVTVDAYGYGWGITVDHLLVAVDPRTAAVVHSVTIPGDIRPTALAAAGGYLWVVSGGDCCEPPLWRVDAATLDVTRAVFLPPSYLPDGSTPDGTPPSQIDGLSSNPAQPDALLVVGFSHYVGTWRYRVVNGELVPVMSSDETWRLGTTQPVNVNAQLAADGASAYTLNIETTPSGSREHICRQDMLTARLSPVCYDWDGKYSNAYYLTTIGSSDYLFTTVGRSPDSSVDQRPDLYLWDGLTPGAAKLAVRLVPNRYDVPGPAVVGPDQRSIWVASATDADEYVPEIRILRLSGTA